MPGLTIPVILGTARPGRRSAEVADLAASYLSSELIDTFIIDVADYAITGTGTDEEQHRLARYRELIADADGFVIVAPEYNHSFPGELKLLLDSAYAEYNRKPVGIVSVSSGLLGGTRMTQQLSLVALALEMIPVSPTVHVPEVKDAVSDDGAFSEAGLEAAFLSMVSEVQFYAGALAGARTAA